MNSNENKIGNNDRRPGVGVAVFITNPKCHSYIVLGLRKGKIGGGLYQIPGGHLEFGETWEEAACREALEETGLVLKNVKFCAVVNSVVPEINYHYVTIMMKGEVSSSTSNCDPQNCEPDKCEGWKWCHWDKLPPAELCFYSLRDFRKLGYSPWQRNNVM